MKSPAKPIAQAHPKPLRGKKTWREKLHDSKGLPKLGLVKGRMAAGLSEATMVIPAPLEVDALMRCVPRGRLTTIDDLRTALATRHRVTVACPITTGIFAWMAAHAADEASSAGEADITPYWRTLKSKGELNPKYPRGLAAIIARLEAEGHVIFQKGKRVYVRDFEKMLTRLSPATSARAPRRKRP
ncbi:MAG: MGMT family protein [Chthoniobacter sp.]|nr:MGMT family protein [Chthoniobacter sp.]